MMMFGRATFGTVAAVALVSAAQAEAASFDDVTATHLPAGPLTARSMAAAAADLDDDGDLDIVVAREFAPNLVLRNDGDGRFPADDVIVLPGAHDSEDIAIADFDGDGDFDIVFIAEDDAAHELHLNEGGAFRDASDRIPIDSIANGVELLDVDADGRPDLIVAANGPDAILINDGNGGFRNEASMRLPPDSDVSQDVTAGDVNGDGHPDLVFANEGRSRVLVNEGDGTFSGRDALPSGARYESREAALGDVDGDGDLDLFLANVAVFMDGADPQNRLFLNDGSGVFAGVTAERLPTDRDMSFEGLMLDIDEDGDLDILTGNTDGLVAPGGAPVRVYLNNGSGWFQEADGLLPPTARGNAFAIVPADFDGDGRLDLYLGLRYGQDRLLLGTD